jgi:hypothetical protein
MSKLLFKLRNVPEDEAIEVRELLDANAIDYFETTPGNWGISMPGLWLSNADDFPRARALLDEYQTARAQRERARFDALRATGEAPTLWQLLRAKPLVVSIQLIAIALLAYLSLRLFPGL